MAQVREGRTTLTTLDRARALCSMRDAAKAQLEKSEGLLQSAKTEVELLSQVLTLLGSTGALARRQIRDVIGRIASSAMQDIFGPDSGAEVQFKPTERGYNARLLTRLGDITGEPLRIDGGSACKILSLAMRIATLLQLDLPRVLFLDEPFTGVDAENIESAVQWLKEVIDDVGLQCIVISHEWPEVWDRYVDNVVEIGEAASYA